MSGKIAGEGQGEEQLAKTTLFAGDSRSDVRRNCREGVSADAAGESHVFRRRSTE